MNFLHIFIFIILARLPPSQSLCFGKPILIAVGKILKPRSLIGGYFAYSMPFGHRFHGDSATQSTVIRPGGRSEATLGF